MSPSAEERAEFDGAALTHYDLPDYARMRLAIQRWTAAVPKQAPASAHSRSVFFFSGHGVGANRTPLLLPADYLDDAARSLPRLASLANVAGLATSRATLSIVKRGATAEPNGPFLAVDVALQEKDARAQWSSDRLKLVDGSGRVYADVSGLSNLAVIDVADVARQLDWQHLLSQIDVDQILAEHSR